MNALQHRILAPFVAETLESLATLADLPARAGDAFEDNLQLFRFKGCAIAIDVSGALAGKVLLHLYPETVKDVGERVFARITGDEADIAAPGDVEAALNEWANVVIGHATRSLEAGNLGIEFASPFFVRDTSEMDVLIKDVVEIVTVPIETQQAGRFYFNYLLHARTAAA